MSSFASRETKAIDTKAFSGDGSIRITSPCDLYPLVPHFYIVKLGFTGVYIIFLFLL